MPKTGTTSLANYLRKQGYKCVHNKPKVERIIKKHNPEKIFNKIKCDAILDYPINLYYKQIEQDYPNAKFIYTTRKRSSWLKSWKEHDKRIKPNIDRTEKFLNLYDKQSNEIPEYFKDKQEKILILDLSDPKKDEKLAEFLGVEPLGYYPHKNKGNYK